MRGRCTRPRARTAARTKRRIGASADQLDRWRVDAGALRHRSRRPAGRRASAGRVVLPLRRAAAGRPLRRASAAPAAAARAAHHPDDGARHRRDDGALQRDLRRADEAAAVAARRSDRRLEGNARRQRAAVRRLHQRRLSRLARARPSTIDDIAAWSQRLVTLTGVGDPERIRITAATASLFPVLGARPLIGSFFEQKDETSPVIVLSERLWRQRFGADPAVLGTVRPSRRRALHRRRRAAGRAGLPGSADAAPSIPYAVRPAAGNYLSMFNAIAALRPGVTAAQAAAEGTARGRFAADTGMTTTAIFGSNGPIEITAQPLRDALTADVRRPLLVLLVAVGLLLADGHRECREPAARARDHEDAARWRFAPRSAPAARA